VETLREMYPNVDLFQQLAPESRLVVRSRLGAGWTPGAKYLALSKAKSKAKLG
jgi:hypothetical protein